MAILKWVFLPAIIIVFILSLVNMSKGRNECGNICNEKGFNSFRYVPHGRYGIPREQCYCLTEEETKEKNRIPSGTKVF